MRPRIASRTGVATASALAVVALLAAACSTDEEPDVDTALTESAASRVLVGYLEESLSALPKGASLTLAHPSSPVGAFNPGGVTPCDDSDTDATGPVFLTLDYWVSGIAETDVAQNLDAIAGYWENRDRPPAERSSGEGRTAVVTMPDGYAIVVDDNGRGSLSVSGTSACFPRANAGGAGQPDVIDRP
ncbi:hypothetical protein [Rhodococcus sp. NPDC058481]|uniref:hypothetical protein n=1 Tax=unclassified Rhodococcus (in: high G+C Gram-positive bacteria) TaxID=192944 RepID=UPI0036615AC2